MKFIIIFAVIIVLKFSLNFYNYIRIKTLDKYFQDFFNGKKENMNFYRQEILSLFKKANIKDVHTPISESIGYGQIVSANVSVFAMIPSKRPLFASVTLNMFKEATGVFYKNMFDCFNPIYWIDCIVFLPKNILLYVGVNSETASFKICNIVFTFTWWTTCVLFTFFKPQIKHLIIELLRKF